jgi:hypothetical protein
LIVVHGGQTGESGDEKLGALSGSRGSR